MMRSTALALGALLTFLAGTTCAEPDAASSDALSSLQAAHRALKRFTLDNGMVCLVREDRSAPVVSIQIWIGTGSIHEGDYLGAGISHAIEHMIFKGTESRPPGQVTREIHDAGGSVNAYTSLDRTMFHADLPARNWQVGLDVLADAIMHANFPAEEWEKERDVILREFAMGRDDPDRVLGKLLWRTAFREHPYRYPVIGYESVFRTLERKDLAAFASAHYVPDNMMAVIVGDIPAEEASRALRRTFADVKRRRRAPVVVPIEPHQAAPRLARLTGSYNVSRLHWAFHTVSLGHPDAAALDVLAEIVGSGRSSRLQLALKERRQLVHSISAWSYTPREPGLFAISATFDPSREQVVMDAIQAQVSSWSTNGFSDTEIAKARRNILVGELGRLQTMKGQAGNYASGEFYTGNPAFAGTYLERINGVSSKQLQEVASRYCTERNRTIAILAPEDEPGMSGKDAGPMPPPAIHELELAGEIPLLVREDRRLPFINVCVAMRGGVLYEDDGEAGITKLAADLLTRGTGSRDSESIARDLDRLGAVLKPFSGFNSFGLRARCLSRDAGTVFDILADCILNPAFPPAEVDKQKALQLAAIEKQMERPFTVARVELRKMLFPGHPYRWLPLGSRETVTRLDIQALQRHMKKLRSTANVAIAVFGDVSPSEAIDLVQPLAQELPSSPVPAVPNSVAASDLPQRAIRFEPRQQAIVLIGFPGIDVRDPRVDALNVIQTAMSGLSSDLAMEIREKRGLAYYAGSYQQVGLTSGLFTVYAGTRIDAVDEVERLMLAEVARVRSDGLRKDELERARARLIADFETGLQDNLDLAMSCALNELYGLGYEHVMQTVERLEGLTPDDIAAAASILSTNRFATSVILPQPNDESAP